MYSSLNISKSGPIMDDARRFMTKVLRTEKSTMGIISNNVFSDTGNLVRLMGGADELKADEAEEAVAVEKVLEEATLPLSESSKPSEPTTVEKMSSPAGPCCFCTSQTYGSAGDKKVDEMIDYIHQNLQEAGKALATLGENFEHDSKLMFVDILGRIQQWSGIVQNKLEVCKNDVEGLRKELASRVCEIGGKEREIAELKAQLTDHKAQTAEASLKPGELKAPILSDAKAQTTAIVTERGMTEDAERQVEAKEVADIPEAQTLEEQKTAASEAPSYADAACQSSTKDKERIRRESELENEVSRLRKENERIVKERAEYENAIQRALLRGVSSLNVEALRVLRCPPIPCCTPCAPCPGSANSTPEQTPPCKSTKDGPSTAAPRTCNVMQRGKSGGYEEGSRTVKRSCASPCCSAGKSRKSADSSMLFLLHQGDAGNICGSNDAATSSRPCGSPLLKRIEIPPCPRFGRQ
ncbi:hypothetical protein KM043_005632 [Ampulex compressa]|nr:hypothetical protein KM043_005632 [Ampulex compressa]